MILDWFCKKIRSPTFSVRFSNKKTHYSTYFSCFFERKFVYVQKQNIEKLGAGLMAGLCAFSMLGTNFNSSFGASAASSYTENVAFPSADTVIAKAATLLGTPYTFGNKGYSGIYTQAHMRRCPSARSTVLVSTVPDLCTTR